MRGHQWRGPHLQLYHNDNDDSDHNDKILVIMLIMVMLMIMMMVMLMITMMALRHHARTSVAGSPFTIIS